MKTIHTDRVHLYRPSSWGVCPWRVRLDRLPSGLWIHVDAGKLFRFWVRIARP